MIDNTQEKVWHPFLVPSVNSCHAALAILFLILSNIGTTFTLCITKKYAKS